MPTLRDTISDRSRVWTALVALATAPILVALIVILWRTPFPVSETIALLEDVANRPRLSFLVPDTPYYRPLFHVTLSTIWNSSLSLDARLGWVRMLHIVPASLLLALFIWAIGPRSFLDAAAAFTAIAVLIGSPGFRDNMELPLSYTTVGMPLGLAAWMLLNAERRAWRAAAIVLLTLVAIGFKEQGLAVVAVIVAAALTRAPGATRRMAMAIVALAAGYVVLRLSWGGSCRCSSKRLDWDSTRLNRGKRSRDSARFRIPSTRTARSARSANVLFSEPTRGVFNIVWTVMHRVAEPWEYIHLVSSTVMTGLIGWWGVRELRRVRHDGWSIESRTFVALVLVLLACGVLSFNYSRDRLGGMATPFYALAAFFAVRAACVHASAAPRVTMMTMAVSLTLLAALWQVRTVGALEALRAFSARNQLEWLTALPSRRVEFAERRTYVTILDAMRAQGWAESAPAPTRYPFGLSRALGPVNTP